MPTNADYAKINIACKELGLDKKQLLADRYRLSTSKDLTRAQLWDLLAHFKKLGWRVKRTAGSPASPRYDDPMQRKIVAMWIELAAAGVVKNRSDRALQAYVKRMSGVANLKWCDGQECFKLIEALKKWGARHDIDFE